MGKLLENWCFRLGHFIGDFVLATHPNAVMTGIINGRPKMLKKLAHFDSESVSLVIAAKKNCNYIALGNADPRWCARVGEDGVAKSLEYLSSLPRPINARHAYARQPPRVMPHYDLPLRDNMPFGHYLYTIDIAATWKANRPRHIIFTQGYLDETEFLFLTAAWRMISERRAERGALALVNAPEEDFKETLTCNTIHDILGPELANRMEIPNEDRPFSAYIAHLYDTRRENSEPDTTDSRNPPVLVPNGRNRPTVSQTGIPAGSQEK